MSKIEDLDLGIGYPREMEITLKQFPKYRDGVNRSDQNKIKKCHEIGYDKFQTSHYLKITTKAIDHWWPKRKRRSPEEMELENAG